MMKNRVIPYTSWTEWHISRDSTDPETILYSGPTVTCPIVEIKENHKTFKYIIVLK